MSVGSENSLPRTDVAAQLTCILCHNLEYMRLYYHISRMLWLCAVWFHLHGIFPQPQIIISNSNQFIYSYTIFSTFFFFFFIFSSLSFYVCIFLFLLLNRYHCVWYPTNISYTYSYFLSILRALWRVKFTLRTNPCLPVCLSHFSATMGLEILMLKHIVAQQWEERLLWQDVWLQCCWMT